MKFAKELYSKTALIKAAYNFTNRAFVHLDADSKYYYVELKMKTPDDQISEDEFVNEMLTQSVRHEVFKQTRNIRELIYARAMATSVVYDSEKQVEEENVDSKFSEDEILKDWFADGNTST